MTKRQSALLRALPILVFTVLFTAVIVFLALRTAGGISDTQQTADDFAFLARACEGQAVPDATPYAATAGVHPVVAFRQAAGEWVLDLAAIQENWTPNTPAGAELVLCLDETQTLTAPRCEPDASGATPTRVYGEAVSLRLVAASSSAIVKETTLRTGIPPACWHEDDPQPPAGNMSTDQLRGWLAPFVNIP